MLANIEKSCHSLAKRKSKFRREDCQVLRIRRVLSSAEVRRSCRYHQELEVEPRGREELRGGARAQDEPRSGRARAQRSCTTAKTGVDTAENEPRKDPEK